MENPVSELLFVGAAAIATCDGPPSAGAGIDPAGVRSAVALLTRDGRIAAIDTEDRLREHAPSARTIDCGGGLLTPGLVDSHTHAVFGRWRADEFVLRCRGVGYMEIAARGGGINASVRDLRGRSEDELLEVGLPRLAEMLHHGTTTAEVKSGYGLTTADELKMLRVVRRLDRLQPISLIPTFLGAHEVPPEYRGRTDAYVDLLVEEMIPAAAEGGLATFCDVFMEPGVFDRAQAERILRAGMAAGLVPKLHADEFEWSGGAELAAEIGAASADHLGAIGEKGIRDLAASNTVATLLPVTLFFLGRGGYAPGRRLLDAGATVALATDFNPGSSPTTSMPFVMTAACAHCGLEPTEALRAATAGGAAALKLGRAAGVLAVGAPADLALWDVPGVDHLPYRVGVNPLRGLWKAGEKVV